MMVPSVRGHWLIQELTDEFQDVGQIDAIRIRHTGAVAIRHVGVHGQDNVRPAQDVRSPGITEADATLALRRVRGQLDEFAAVAMIALD